MFGIDFYPTPAEVIDRMLMDVEVCGKYVLEPSAGSGNIVNALQERGKVSLIVWLGGLPCIHVNRPSGDNWGA